MSHAGTFWDIFSLLRKNLTEYDTVQFGGQATLIFLFDADLYGTQQVRNTRPCSVVGDYLLEYNTLSWAHSSLSEVIPSFLFLCFRATQDFINNCPKRCNNQQSIYLLQGHSTCLGCRRTHHQEYIKLTIASGTGHIIGEATSFQRGQVRTPNLATLE